MVFRGRGRGRTGGFQKPRGGFRGRWRGRGARARGEASQSHRRDHDLDGPRDNRPDSKNVHTDNLMNMPNVDIGPSDASFDEAFAGGKDSVYEQKQDRRSKSRERSRSPIRGRLGAEDSQYDKHPENEEDLESLQITVGNDNFQNQQRNTPLSERLGPPVTPADYLEAGIAYSQQRDDSRKDDYPRDMQEGDGDRYPYNREERGENYEKTRSNDRDSFGHKEGQRSRERDRFRKKDGERCEDRGREKHDSRELNRDKRRSSRDRDRYSGSRERGRSDSYREPNRGSLRDRHRDSREKERFSSSKGREGDYHKSRDGARFGQSRDDRNKYSSKEKSFDHGSRGHSRDSHDLRDHDRSRSRPQDRPRSQEKDIYSLMGRSRDLNDRYVDNRGPNSQEAIMEKKQSDANPRMQNDKPGETRGECRDKFGGHSAERENSGIRNEYQHLIRHLDDSESKANSSSLEHSLDIKPTLHLPSVQNVTNIQPSLQNPRKTGLPNMFASPYDDLPTPFEKKLTRQTMSDARPLKSILKKKSEQTDEDFLHSEPNERDFSEQLQPEMKLEMMTSDAPSKRERRSTSSALPGMSSYMDIEDEEKFLYGDEDHSVSHMAPLHQQDAIHVISATSNHNFLSHQKSSSLEPTSLFSKNAPQNIQILADVKENKREAIPQMFGEKESWISQSESVGQNPTDGLLNIPQKNSTDGLLNIPQREKPNPPLDKQLGTGTMDIWDFLSKPKMPNTSAEPNTNTQLETSKKNDNYDPTIENILKSIGFDFEMSKRMQERAKQKDVPVEQINPEESQFGINQTASFLSSGLTVDELQSSFGENKESNVEKLIREAKENVKHVKKDYRSRESQAMKYQNEEQQFGQDDFQPQDSFFNVMEYKNDPYSRKEIIMQRDEYHRSRDNSSDHDRYTQDFPHQRRSLSSSSSNFSDDGSYSSRSSQSGSASSNRNRYNKSRRQQSLNYRKSITKSPEPYPHNQPEDRYSGKFPDSQDMYNMPPGIPQTNVYSTYPHQQPPIYSQPGYGMIPPQPLPPGYNTYVPPGYIPNHPTQPYYEPYPPETDDYSPLKVNRPSTLREIPMVDTASVFSDKRIMGATAHEFKESKPFEKIIVTAKTESNRTVLPPKMEHKRFMKELKQDHEKVADLKKPKLVLTRKEYDKLLNDHDMNKKSLRTLEKELQKLRKQQNELMRKRQRQKGGHKDPVLQENNKLQEEISIQVSKLRKNIWDAAKILKETTLEETKSSGSEMKSSKKSKTNTEEIHPKTPAAQVEKKVKNENQLKGGKNQIRFEFYDPGSHWCRNCNAISGNVYEVFSHLQSKKHQQTLNPYNRPWMPESLKNPISKPSGPAQVTPMKGVEFLIATEAFYCSLCLQFSGDAMCAEDHLKSEAHFKKYQQYIDENPFYERRYNLDKAAGVSIRGLDRHDSEKLAEQTEILEEKKEKRKGEDEKLKEEKRRRIENPKGLEIAEKKPESRKSQSDRESKSKNVAVKSDTNQKSKSSSKIEEKHVSSQGFGKFDFKKEKEKKEKTGEKKQEQKKTSESQKSEGDKNGQTQEAKGKIAIKLTGKSGIKPVEPKPMPPRNPILPPWKPVVKKEQIPLRKAKSKVAKPAPLDTFLSTSSKSVPLPVVKETLKVAKIPLPKHIVNPKEISAAFSGKLAEEKTVQTKKNEKSSDKAVLSKEPSVKTTTTISDEASKTVVKDIFAVETTNDNLSVKTLEAMAAFETMMGTVSAEELGDLKMLGIDPSTEQPLAIPKPPPLLCHNKVLVGVVPDKMVTSSVEDLYGIFYKTEEKKPEVQEIINSVNNEEIITGSVNDVDNTMEVTDITGSVNDVFNTVEVTDITGSVNDVFNTVEVTDITGSVNDVFNTVEVTDITGSVNDVFNTVEVTDITGSVNDVDNTMEITDTKEADDNEDVASEGSSMIMGSDFEIVDECEEDPEP